MGERLVIRGAVLAGDPPREGVTVVVEGSRIAAVLANGDGVEPQPGDWDVPADGRLLVPGAVDAHAHLALGPLLRLVGLPERFPGSVRALRMGFRRPVEDRLRPAALEALALAGALESLRAGVTCVLALERAAPGEELEVLSALARAVRRVGLRAALAYGASDLGGADRGLAAARAASAFGEERLGDPLVRGMAGLEGLYATTPGTLEALAEPASRFGLHASISEDGSDLERSWALDGRRPVELLHAKGLLGPKTIVAHGCNTGSDEASLLRRADAALVATPRAASWWGVELPPFEILAAHEVPVALGTDGIFPGPAGEAVALAAHLRRRGSGPPAPAELIGHVVWPTAAALAGQLFGERLGAIEPGALADLALLDWRPAAAPPEGTDGDVAILWAGAPAAWVIVGGEVRLREGAPLGVDPTEVAARAREAARRALSD
ncbi:MAG TPA: amidohydrolase family protein [Anaeromyxobacteraceae bacterium]|nr:amidohydrolase family protein [Anaeromyxobacteraceae bacterium]